MYKPSDVEIINDLCRIDDCLREAKKAVDKLNGQCPEQLYPVAKVMFDNVKTLLKVKNKLRRELWKEYKIFYMSDI